MCFTSCFCLVEFLPYIVLVLVPLYGSFCGVDTILRLSLLLCVHSAIGQQIPKGLYSVVPYLQLILFGILLWLPVSLTPWFVIWLYDKLLWLSEPLLLVAEIVMVLLSVMRLSQRAVEKMQEDDDEADKWKWAMLLVSLLLYALTVGLCVAVCYGGSSVIRWLLFAVIVLSLTMHNMMWLSNDGIITDVAFLGLCSAAVVYMMKLEAFDITHPVKPPDQWWSRDGSQSFFGLLINVAYSSLDSAGQSIQLLKKFLSPFFLFSLVIRLYTILCLVEILLKKFGKLRQSAFSTLPLRFFKWNKNSDASLAFSLALFILPFIISNLSLWTEHPCISKQEDCLDSDDELDADNIDWKVSPWRSTLLLKLLVIFMFTQLVIQHLNQCSGQHSSHMAWFSSWIALWPVDLLPSRLMQLATLNIFYMYRLYQAEDWNSSDWT